MQAKQSNARWVHTGGKRQLRDNVKGAVIRLGWIQRQIIFQYYAGLVCMMPYHMPYCVPWFECQLIIQYPEAAVSCPPILWQAKVAITCSLPIAHLSQSNSSTSWWTTSHNTSWWTKGRHKKKLFFLLSVKKLRPPPSPFLTTSVFSDKDFFDSAQTPPPFRQIW